MRAFTILFILQFTSQLISASATVLWVNNHPFYGSIDIHIVDAGTPDIKAMVSDLEYVECAVPVEVPSSMFLVVEIYISGSDEMIGSSDYLVYTANTQYIGMIVGTSASDMEVLGNVVPTTWWLGNFKTQARHSKPGIEPIDFILRENNVIIGNNLEYSSISTDVVTVPVGNYILDIKPATDNSYGLFAYELNCNGCDTQYIYFFLSGNPFDPDCYALFSDGTCINLPHTDPFVGIEERKSQFGIFPNPADDYVTIKSQKHIDLSNGITIMDVTGRVLSLNFIMQSDSKQLLLDVSSIPSGLYTTTIFFADGSKSTQRFLKN
jgi:hypothetical protein